MPPLNPSMSTDFFDYMKFAEAWCDSLANMLLDSEFLAMRIGIESEKLEGQGDENHERQGREYFLSSGSTLLLTEVWEDFVWPACARAIFFLDDRHNLLIPTMQDTALLVRDEFQSSGIGGGVSICWFLPIASSSYEIRRPAEPPGLHLWQQPV
jgi:hypothetical protein